MIYGWFQAMILIHQMHDSCHSALGYSPAWWKFFGRLTQEWIAGNTFHFQTTIIIININIRLILISTRSLNGSMAQSTCSRTSCVY